MPYPSQIDPQAVVQLARQMIEDDGVENLSLARLAKALKVSAPSFYKHFDSKGVLLQAVNLQTSRALVTALATEDEQTDAAERLIAMARNYRAFVRTHPRTYALAFSNLSPDTRPDPAQLERLAIPLQEQMAWLTGNENALTALRGFWALIHGFCMLEINQQFQRGGDLDVAFTRSVEAYLAGWTQSR